MTQVNNIKLNVYKAANCPQNYPDIHIVKAHKSKIMTFKQIILQKNYIATCGMDGYICFWSSEFKLMGKFNIGDPLPIKWEITFNNSVQQI